MAAYVSTLGFLAGTLTTVSFLPQLIKTIRRKSAKDISFAMLTVFTSGVGLWLVYGLLLHDLPIIVANAVTLALVLAILVLKIYYGRLD